MSAADAVGRRYPKTAAYEVGREKIREFAEAIGDDNPAYLDQAAAQKLGHPDVIAPPTFPIVFTMRSTGGAVLDPDLGIDYSRVVHGEQRFVYQRPVRAGDRLVCESVVEDLKDRAGSIFLYMRTDVTTEDGEPVLAAHSVIVSRAPEKES
jgi:acyl dehydratase